MVEQRLFHQCSGTRLVYPFCTRFLAAHNWSLIFDLYRTSVVAASPTTACDATAIRDVVVDEGEEDVVLRITAARDQRLTKPSRDQRPAV